MSKRNHPVRLNLKTLYKTSYGWPLRQIKIPQAHKLTKGSQDVIVAVIDIGYHRHKDHAGHLWINPNPTKGDIHGWDFEDNDATLECSLMLGAEYYWTGHHSFVVGEVIACAPKCKIMPLRVGYRNKTSWHKAVDYAVEHRAKILVMPHSFFTHGKNDFSMPLFYMGTDFGYPVDNPKIRRSLERANEKGCLIFQGAASNTGRRTVNPVCSFEAVISVGSSNRKNQAADICCSSDIVEIAAPGGQRSGNKLKEHCWSTGGSEDYVSFTGGCMASGYAGGVAALVCSKFPKLNNKEIRQILCNTADNKNWDPKLGWGLINASKAVSLSPEHLCQNLKIKRSKCKLKRINKNPILEVFLENHGVFNVEKALVVAYNGDPSKPGVPGANIKDEIPLVTQQIGHSIIAVRGLNASLVEVELTEEAKGRIWVQVSIMDMHGDDKAEIANLLIK